MNGNVWMNSCTYRKRQKLQMAKLQTLSSQYSDIHKSNNNKHGKSPSFQKFKFLTVSHPTCDIRLDQGLTIIPRNLLVTE